MRILLIDDSLAYLEEFTDLLADGPFVDAGLHHARTADEGARLMNRCEHDIYFVDYRLAGASGLDLIRDARAAGVDRPMICLTGFDDPRLDLEAEGAGANDYLPKGDFSAQGLSRAIRYTLRNAADVRVAREAENRFRLAQEAANIGTWDWDLGRGAMQWSPRQRAMFGLDPDGSEPATDAAWRRAIHPDDLDQVQAAILAGVRGDAPFAMQFRVVLGHGRAPSVRWLASQGLVMRNARGETSRVVGVTVDVTDQQLALAEMQRSRNSALADLHLSEDRFQAYFDNSSDGLFHVRIMPAGGFVYAACNPACLAGTGFTTATAKGMTPELVLGHEVGGAITADLAYVRDSGQPLRHEVRVPAPSGAVTLDIHYVPLRDGGGGAVTGVLGNMRDITERLRLEESLRQAQKMQLFGQLAGGVAHDFNNILQSVTSCLELALDEAVLGTRVEEFLSVALRAVERGSALTHQLLAYARRQVLRPQSVALAALLGDLETLILSRFGPTIAVTVNIDDHAAHVHADPGQLQNALLNLAINAAQAMPDGGKLAIATWTTIRGGRTWVALSLTDNGIGMDEATLMQAVEPFFTTKGTRGTGLGLSMVQGFVDQSGGQFSIRSQPGAGTMIELLLPPARPAVPESEAPEPVIVPCAGARLLLVDDDPDVLLTLGVFLEWEGFTVVRARSGEAALDLLRQSDPVDAIITDFAMPRLNGADTIARARALRPNLPAILISGFVAESDTGNPGHGVDILRKPFRRQALLRALVGILNEPPAVEGGKQEVLF